jgi:SWI/SNF-related matrix-associated actin-dependent regulator of chromatin subfamily A3
MPPRRKRAAEAVDIIDLTGDAPQPARKRPNLSSSKPSQVASGAKSRQKIPTPSSQASAQASTQEPDYLDLTQDDDAFDKELYGTFGLSRLSIQEF